MKNSVKKITHLLFAWLLIGIVGLLTANEVVYKHTHKVDGKVVIHAHPFNKSQDTAPLKSHTHSTTQFLIIDNLDFLFPLLFLFFTCLEISKKIVFTLYNYFNLPTNPLLLQQGRAPPIR